MATGRQHFFPPSSAYLGNQSLRAGPVLGCVRWIHPALVSPSFFPRSLSPPGQIPDWHTALQRELSSSGGEEGGWRWEPHPQDTRSPETPPSSGGARVGSAAAETPGSGDGGLRQRGTGGQVRGGLTRAQPAQRPQPQDSPTGGPDPAQAPGP